MLVLLTIYYQAVYQGVRAHETVFAVQLSPDRSLLARASAHTRTAAAKLSDDDLDRQVVRPPRPDGTRRVFNVRWVLYHMIEHTAGHFGQIQLLLHLMGGAEE